MEEIERKNRSNLPLVCFLCRDRKLNTDELNVLRYFEMQMLNLDIDD